MGKNRLGQKQASTLHQSEHCHSIVFPSEYSKTDPLPHRHPSISSQPSLAQAAMAYKLHILAWPL